MTDEDRIAEDKFDTLAEGIQLDVLGDNPDAPTEYDVWIEHLVLGIDRWPYAKKVKVGVIDMGESFQGTYVYEDGKWEPESSLDPAVMIDRIIEERARA